MISFKVTGIDKLTDSFEKTIDSVDKPKMEPHVLWGANKMRSKIRNEIRRQKLRKTGNLSRGQIRKKLPRRFGYPAAAVVRPNWRKAPHSYFMNYGTQERVQYKTTGREVGRVQPTYFFTATTDQHGSSIQQEVLNRIANDVDKGMR